MKEMFVLFFQSPHVHSLEQTKADLMESLGESRKRKDEIEVRSYFFCRGPSLHTNMFISRC